MFGGRVRSWFSGFHKRHFEFGMAREIFGLVLCIARNDGANRFSCLFAFCALKHLVDSYDNASAILMRPVRSEWIDVHGLVLSLAAALLGVKTVPALGFFREEEPPFLTLAVMRHFRVEKEPTVADVKAIAASVYEPKARLWNRRSLVLSSMPENELY